MIYGKEPKQVLYEALQSLEATIPIYKEGMDEDENSTPESYLLLKSDVTNTTALFGDGHTEVRTSECDVLLVTKGVNGNTTSLHWLNAAKVTVALDTAGITYKGYSLGYDSTLKNSQYSWSMNIDYVEI
jgi:hypothetical protein